MADSAKGYVAVGIQPRSTYPVCLPTSTKVHVTGSIGTYLSRLGLCVRRCGCDALWRFRRVRVAIDGCIEKVILPDFKIRLIAAVDVVLYVADDLKGIVVCYRR